MIISISLHDKRDQDLIAFLKSGDKSAKVRQALRLWLKWQNKIENAVVGESTPIVESPKPSSKDLAPLKARELTEKELEAKLDNML